jgi:anti-sigma regulatory factor (Ser/Thr protein kinase)
LVKVLIEDSGKGFDYQAQDINYNETTHGRGLSLIHEIAKEVNYSNNGATVEVIYSLV